MLRDSSEGVGGSSELFLGLMAFTTDILINKAIQFDF